MKYFVLGCALLIAVSAVGQVKFGIHGNIISSDLTATLQNIAGVPPNTSTTGVIMNEVYNLGLGGGIHLDFDLGLLTIRVSGDYITLSPDQEKFKNAVQAYAPGLAVSVDGGRITVIQGTANAKLVLFPFPVVKIYATGGGGFAPVSSTTATLTLGTTKITLEPITKQTVGTANVGAGVDIALGSMALFGEIKLNWLWLKEGTLGYLPIGTVGLTF